MRTDNGTLKRILVSVLAVVIAFSGSVTCIHAENEKNISAAENEKTVSAAENKETGEDSETTDTDEADDEADRVTVNISSIDDFVDFDEECRKGVDTSDMDVQLLVNLDLSEYDDFGGLHSFSGHFHGNGHSVKGVNLSEGDAAIGLFSYIEQGALVENIDVEVSLGSDDSSNYIGGIAGINAGVIRDCTVDGIITGVGSTGGIAGLNGGMGIIDGCENKAYVMSGQSVGGIAGENRGTITGCKNSGSVNEDSDWLSEEDEAVISLTAEGILNYLTSVASDQKDIGGIAGFSKGVIIDSWNLGTVGYQHAGRNVGGIAGRFCGQITDCTNTGKVYGKQDVGGIAGQFEPQIILQAGESIATASDRLNALQNKLVSDVNDAKTNVENSLNNLTDTISSEVSEYTGDDTDIKQTLDTESEKPAEEKKSDAENTVNQIKDAADRAVNSAKETAAGTTDVEEIKNKIDNAGDGLTDYDDISESLASVSDALTSAQDTINAHADTLVNDVNKINDEVTDLNNIVEDQKDNLERIKDGGDLIEDYSAIDYDNPLASKISGCENTGYVNGDRNVGGIAGAMAIEGSDSDDNESADTSDIHMTLAVLSGCKNSGIVIVKKENGAGITGYGDMGLISDSVDTGFTVADDANFIGGIAGNYKGTIDSCTSISVISANKYAGGIAGQARRVRNCYSMAALCNTNGWTGAVIGNVTSETREEDYSVIHANQMNSIYNNYYVSDNLYGINGISYEGVAEGIGYEALKAAEGVAKEAGQLFVTFLDDNYNLIGRTSVDYGDNLGQIKYPEIATEEGEYITWSGFYSKNVVGNVYLLASSEDKSVTIASEGRRAGKVLAYVSGSFTELSSVVVTDQTDDFFSKQQGEETETVYEIKLSDTSSDDDSVATVRVLKPDDKDLDTVYVKDGDDWEEVASEEIGSYIQFDITGTDAIIRIHGEDKPDYRILMAAGGIVIVLVAAKIAVKKKKQRKEAYERTNHDQGSDI